VAPVATAATEEAPRAEGEPVAVAVPADQAQAEPAPPAPPPQVGSVEQGSATIVTILPPEQPRGEAPALKLGSTAPPAAPPAPLAPSTPPPAPAPTVRAQASPRSDDDAERAAVPVRTAAEPSRPIVERAGVAAATYRPASHVPRRTAAVRRAATEAPAHARVTPLPRPQATRRAPAPALRLASAAPPAIAAAAPETIPAALLVALAGGLGLMLASTLPRAVVGSPRPRWVEQSQVAVGGIGLACALGAFAVLLAAA
jgi:hypothetical protein